MTEQARVWHIAAPEPLRLPKPDRRTGNRCHYCRSTTKPLTIDHIVPRSRGGQNTAWNYVAACIRCNQDKANRLPTCKCDHCQRAIDLHWQWLMEQRGNRAELTRLVEPLYRDRWKDTPCSLSSSSSSSP